MALPAWALITVTELKSYFPLASTSRDPELEQAIARATRDIESYVDRRLVYRAPTEDDDNIVTAVAWADGSAPTNGQPDAAGRNLVVTFPSTATAGVITFTGTVQGVAGQTEAFDVTKGLLQYGQKPFTAFSARAIAGATGAGNVKAGTTKGYIEFFSVRRDCAEIVPMEWPIRSDSVIELNEDLNRVFASTTVLATSLYEVRSGGTVGRRVARLSNRLDFPFLGGRRVVMQRYAGGYRNTAEVPGDLKEVAAELAAWKFQYGDRKELGFQTKIDGAGTRIFSGPPLLTSGMRNRLAPYLRAEFEPTAERDFDLEAA